MLNLVVKVKNLLNSSAPKIWKWIIVIIIAAILSTVAALGLKGVISFFPKDSLVVSLIDSINEEWYMNTFFSDRNSSGVIDRDMSGIVIVDVKDEYSSRDSIALVIRKIASLSPKIICIDFLFPKSESYDIEKNNYLFNTLKQIKDSTNIVVVGYKGFAEDISHSFFMDSLKIEYGLSDFPSFNQYSPYIADSIPRISAKIAQMTGIDINDFTLPMTINYGNKDFMRIPVKDGLDVLRGNLTNKIVLLGQYNTPEDVHASPFIINGRKQISGIEEIAYEISSLTASMESPDYYIRCPYKYLSTWGNMLLYCALVLIYVSFLVLIMKAFNNKYLLLLLKPILLILAEYIMIKCCFEYTAHMMQIPNIVLFASSLPFVGLAYDLSIVLTKKIL